MARAVGLDIGTRTIKVVELSGTPKSFKVVRAVTRVIPPPPPNPGEGEIVQDADEVVADLIREVFDSLKLPRDDVCVAFDAGATIFREISVPFFEDDQIRKVVTFEAENHLHSHSLEDVIINWVKTGENRDGSRLTVFASPKAELAERIGVLRTAGIEPSAIDLDATAVYSAYDAAGVFEEKPNVILIDVGARSTTLMLTAQGKPLVLRSFLLGTDQVEVGISKELHVSLEEGRRRTHLPSGPQPDDLLVPTMALAPPAEETEKSLDQLEGDVATELRGTFVRKLHREAMRSLAGVQQGSAPDRILLLGGGSLLPGLSKELEERFGLPVERIDLAEYVDWKDPGAEPAFIQAVTPAAVGCALRILGHNPFDVELLKDEFAPTNRFDVIKTALATAVTLLFIVLLAMAFVAAEGRRAAQSRYKYSVDKAQSMFLNAEMAYLTKVDDRTEEEARTILRSYLTNTIPRDERKFQVLRARLNSRYKNLDLILGGGDIPKVRSALEVWKEIYRALNQKDRGEYGRWLRILKLEVKQRSAVVRIEVDDQTAFDKVQQQFEQSPFFREAARDSTRVVEPGAAQFKNGHWQREYEFRFRESD